ncbi:MAG: penicillin-binding transpeptidase domain-containing protein, partial [Alphaproteobacteria bacterium]
RKINTMTIAYGHGIAVSPAQLAESVATVANGGIRYPATVLKPFKDEPAKGLRVLKRRTSLEIRKLMRLVVTGGTGRQGHAPGYLVGGKTGTAEKTRGRGYWTKALVSSFVGVFPITAPRYVVLVVIDQPRGNKRTYGYATGGWVAAPAVSRIISRAAPLLGVAPVDEESEQVRRALRVRIPTAPRGRQGHNIASF